MARATGYVMFNDGGAGHYLIQIYTGACMRGDPTAFVVRNLECVWVLPCGDMWVEWVPVK